MDTKKLDEAKQEALRFLDRVAALEKRRDEDRQGDIWWMTGCPETGAVRRASMDLTRALSRLRSRDAA